MNTSDKLKVIVYNFNAGMIIEQGNGETEEPDVIRIEVDEIDDLVLSILRAKAQLQDKGGGK